MPSFRSAHALHSLWPSTLRTRLEADTWWFCFVIRAPKERYNLRACKEVHVKRSEDHSYKLLDIKQQVAHRAKPPWQNYDISLHTHLQPPTSPSGAGNCNCLLANISTPLPNTSKPKSAPWA